VTSAKIFAKTGYQTETILHLVERSDWLNAVFPQWQHRLAHHLLLLLRPGLYRDSKFKFLE